MAAGLSATDIANMKAAAAFAATQFTSNYTDNIHVNIFVTAVSGTGTLGMSNTFLNSVPSYSSLRAAVAADSKTPDDATVLGAGGSLPTTDPIGGNDLYVVSRAEAKALDLTADDLSNDGTFTFGGGFSYTYDPNNRAVAGKTDFIGVAMHEFSEIMGRIPLMGQDLFGTGASDYMLFDLFHFTGAGTRGLNNGAGRSFSIDNGTTLLKAFNNAAVNGGDLDDWASGTNDCFNAFSSSSVENDLTTVDLRVMDVIGYDRVTATPTPTPTPTATPGSGPAVMVSPAPGSTFTSSTATFQWTAGSATAYALTLGSAAKGTDIYSSSVISALSATVTGIPTDGRTVFATLYSRVNNVWTNNAYTYRAANGSTSLTPVVNATYTTPTEVPIVSDRFTAIGKTLNIALKFPPAPGTELMVVRNTGPEIIRGTFANLRQGQIIPLTYAGLTYYFIANYHGGQGNDLVLLWTDRSLLPAAVLNKLDSQVVLALKQARGQAPFNKPTSLRPDIPIRDGNGRVLVDITATVSAKLLDEVAVLSGRVSDGSVTDNGFRAMVPLLQLETLAGRSDVTSISPSRPTLTSVIESDGF
jgi:hypothetical protein